MIEPCGENKTIILRKNMIETWKASRIRRSDMGKLNIAIKDETEERFRRAVADHMGLKKGNISKAMEEAIEMWIDHVDNINRKTSVKAKIR